MDERLPNCPDHTCLCLTSFGGRICFGLLLSAQPDGPLYNTHRRCETEGGYVDSGAGVAPGDLDTQEFNLADAYYEVSGYILAMRSING